MSEREVASSFEESSYGRQALAAERMWPEMLAEMEREVERLRALGVEVWLES